MCAEAEEFAYEVVRNCSLSQSGRTLALVLMGGTTLTVGLGITFLYGAWPVLPYAGIEILVLWAGFRWIAGHDGDYERITVQGSEFRHELRVRQRVDRRTWNRHWATLMCRTRGSRVDLSLRSHGSEASIGRMMMDEDRSRLADDLCGLIRVTRTTY